MLKVIKLLITGCIYSSDICRRINLLYNSGKTIPEIQKRLNVSRATVQAYLPYKKCIYNAKEHSLNAERIRRYRERKKQETVSAQNLIKQASDSSDSSPYYTTDDSSRNA